MPAGADIGALVGLVSALGTGNIAAAPAATSGGGALGGLFDKLFGGDDGEDNLERELAFQSKFGFRAPTGVFRDQLVPQRIQAILALFNDTGRHFIAQLNDVTGGPPGGGASVVFNVDSVGDLPVPNAAGFPQFRLGPSPWRALVAQIGARDSEVVQLVNAGVIRFERGAVRLIPPAQPQPAQAPPAQMEGQTMGVGAALGDFLGGVRDFAAAFGGERFPPNAAGFPMSSQAISFQQRIPHVQTAAGLPFVDIIPEPGQTFGGLCPSMFRPGSASVRPVKRIMQQNPTRPERIEVWEHRGTPVLYSGDYGCAKRLARVARRAGRRGRR